MVCHRPGEVKLDLTFWLIAADRWGLNWKNPVHEEGGVYDVSPRYRGRWFWELAQIGAVPTVHLERVRHQTQLRTCYPSTLRCLGPEKKNAILTGIAPHCGPQPSGTSPALGWSILAVKPSRRGGGQQGSVAAGLPTKICQNAPKNIIF